MLFTDRSIWTMFHGIVLGGAALMTLSAALFYLYAARTSGPPRDVVAHSAGAFAGLTVITAVMLWLTVVVGTYVIFPPYRATPPAGLTNLTQFPRAFVLASPETAWLHAFAMEIKEHAPWIAAMLATAVASVSLRYRSKVLTDPSLWTMTTTLLAICFGLVAFASVMGVFVNKVAPLQ